MATDERAEPSRSDRRSFIAASVAAAAAALTPRWARAFGEESKFTITRLQYSGDWNPRPNAARRLLVEVAKATSVEVRHEAVDLRADDRRIFHTPFIWWAGSSEFPPLSADARANLGRYLRFGGVLLADDTEGVSGSGFDKSFRREMAAILPEVKLERLPDDHALFRSFFLVEPNKAIGRLATHPYVEGVTFGNWTPVIHTLNDLGGALARDPFGNYEFDCVPGGLEQRGWALRFAVNIVLYALTANYKKDQIHVKEILRRQRR